MGRIKQAFVSWSGGKDSYMALETAIEQGFTVTHLLTMFDESGERSRSHAVSRELIQRQADALDLQLVTANASWTDYERVFVNAVANLQEKGVEFGIFGDIYLDAHREWEEKVCANANVDAVLPLWGIDTKELAERFISGGGHSWVICVDGNFLDESFCKQNYDRDFVNTLPPNVDVCGENGEFHTFVYDGKLFSEPVNFSVNRTYMHEILLPDNSLGKYFYCELA